MKLYERNQKILEKILNTNEETVALRESIKRKLGFDFVTDKEKFPVLDEGYSWKKTLQNLREADAESAFPQVLRAGVQNICNNMYMSTKTTFERFVTIINSDKITELFAPLVGVGFPREIGMNELYPEVGAQGLDVSLTAKLFGSIFPVSKWLVMDDQTGQFQRMSGNLGVYLKLVQEAYAYGKLLSLPNMQYADLKIPQSQTKPSYESVWPWSVALKGGGKNRPASYAKLLQGNLQEAFTGLANMVNELGLKMLVDPDLLVVGYPYRFDAGVLLNSSWYPSGAASAGDVGGAFAANQLKGICDLEITRFMPSYTTGAFDGASKAWLLMDSKQPWLPMTMRSGPAVEQEQPNSGDSFNRDLIRFKGNIRFECDWVSARFAWLGNDGSAT